MVDGGRLNVSTLTAHTAAGGKENNREPTAATQPKQRPAASAERSMAGREGRSIVVPRLYGHVYGHVHANGLYEHMYNHVHTRVHRHMHGHML